VSEPSAAEGTGRHAGSEAERLRAAITCLAPPWHGVYFDAVNSTQDEARRAARAGALTNGVFVADYQRAGRGRLGRTWLSQPGAGLLLSLLFRELTPTAPKPLRWTSLAAVSLADAIEAIAPNVQPAIKWPNDVLIDGRKVAGVLAETSWDGRELVAIVGVGVNVKPSADTAFAAISVSDAAGGSIDRAGLFSAFITQLDRWQRQPSEALRAKWQARLWGRGQQLRLADLGREEVVTVLGVTPDGSLRVRLANGAEHVTSTGELIL
jgi:BirA family biotin operon repressor/biotin-[acetyl-CoA-carboxylase] ligase